MVSFKIYGSDLIPHLLEIRWEQADVVADKNGGGGKARQNLDKDIRTVVIKEDVIAVVASSDLSLIHI